MTTTTDNNQRLTFLKEWKPYQFKRMEKFIAAHFREKRLRTSHGDYYLPNVGTNYKKVNNIMGLAYTSTGIWACYGVCNTEPYFDLRNVYQYAYFVMDKEDNCYAILQDKDEKELIIPL